ncbi:hypothetical protein F5Y14DRAFT_267176 [Nemania sp. NC0429]|nr:hypothetical protein F5Y14DRAFT_267176 [Nemania sp. NC0429]
MSEPKKLSALDSDLIHIEESRQLLPVSDRSCRETHGDHVLSKKLYFLGIHILLILLVALVSIRGDMKDVKGETWSPAREFIEYELNGQHATNHEQYSKYSGRPSVEQEEAWEALVKPAYFNASLEDFKRAGESVENAAELLGGGFLATIGVYHELHCLRQLRFYLYRSRYYSNMTTEDENYVQGHLDHCLESLRLTIMCYGNPSVYSFVWNDLEETKPATKSNSKSVCAKWDTIETWGLSRMVSTNPKLQLPLELVDTPVHSSS